MSCLTHNGTIERCDCNVLRLAWFAAALLSLCPAIQAAAPPGWKHLSSADGQIPVPVTGTEQTASLVLDVDRDGDNDVVITERTATPSVVWLRRERDGWRRYVIDDTRLHVEAGGAFFDVDGDGDLDIVFGGDSSSNSVWWWENPHPRFEPDRPWKRHLIKNQGATKHHDRLFGDFDGDGKVELAFWNQGARSLCLAEIPENPREVQTWPYRVIYQWSGGAEHEGMAKADIDGDGTLDIIGGGRWFGHAGGGRFTEHVIDDAMRFTRAAAGQLVSGARPEVVFVPGDADGPLRWYEWDGDRWIGHTLLDKVIHGHSIDLGDVDGDGNLDLFVGEMGAWGRDSRNDDARTMVFYGDGRGGFRMSVVARGYGNHESRLADLDGDGDLDILQKPYGWNTPRLDVWLNERK